MTSSVDFPNPSFDGPRSEETTPTSNSMPTTLMKAKHWRKKATDEDWAGNFEAALRYHLIADAYMARHMEGDIYDPPF